jgi:hypothetical protein
MACFNFLALSMKSKFWKILRGIIILSAGYWLITTLYFGHNEIDEKKGVYNFYWSGLNALFTKNKEFGIQKNSIVKTELTGIDGPYIIGNKSYTIDQKNKLIESTIVPGKPFSVILNDPEIKSFKISPKAAHHNQDYTYTMPKKLIAISDIEGNFVGFYSFLLANKVIDKDYNWIFGEGHLVLNGDFVDRGDQVTQVLWLIYKLEQQAEQAGGKVHYILGNHDIMMMQGNVSYSDYKYIEAAKQISKQHEWDKAMRFLYGPESELGKWLRTKNIIERIGSTLFVHAGLNIKHAAEKIDIGTFNRIARKYYGIYPSKTYTDAKEALTLNSINGPYWDRSLAMDFKNKSMFLIHGIPMKETTQQELDTILAYYQASNIVIGHSMVSDITADYQGKVIKIDIKHGHQMNSGLTKGIMMEQNNIFKIDDKGGKTEL